MKELREFKALLISPYLKREFDYYELTSDKGRKVIPFKTAGFLSESFYMPDEVEKLPGEGHLIFIGSTIDSERMVKMMQDKGTPIVRYSKFYGGRSEYSNKTGEEGGYSLDIPKEPSYVKALLEKDSFLEAILERNPEKVRKSLQELNKNLSIPVLATSFLDIALR